MDDVLARADQLANAIQESDAFLAMRRLESELARRLFSSLRGLTDRGRAAAGGPEDAS